MAAAIPGVIVVVTDPDDPPGLAAVIAIDALPDHGLGGPGAGVNPATSTTVVYGQTTTMMVDNPMPPDDEAPQPQPPPPPTTPTPIPTPTPTHLHPTTPPQQPHPPATPPHTRSSEWHIRQLPAPPGSTTTAPPLGSNTGRAHRGPDGPGTTAHRTACADADETTQAMADHQIAATSLTATVGTQTHVPRRAAPPRPSGTLPEPWIDPRGTHPNSRWHGTIQPTQEELGAYDRAESLLHESQSRRCLRQQCDHDDAINSTEAHDPLSRCWVHEASYVRWYNFYIKNGETTEAAAAMARYQAGESRCRLCCLIDTDAPSPGDMTEQPELPTGSESHLDPPFHTTDADDHDEDSDPGDTDAAAAPGTTADGGHENTDEGHATPPGPLTLPLPAPDAGPHQHA